MKIVSDLPVTKPCKIPLFVLASSNVNPVTMTCDLFLTANQKIDYNSEEARLNALFDQPTQEPEPPSIMSPVDSLAKSLTEKSQIGNSTAVTNQGELLHHH